MRSADRDLTVRSYQVRADTLNEKERSIEAVIATEAPVLALDLRSWRVVEEILLMDGVILPKSRQVPLLDTHDRSTVQKIAGSTRDIRVDADKLVGKNVYSESGSGATAFQLTREGHLTDNSIGYRVLNYTTIEPGKSGIISGRTFKASKTRALRVSTAWEVKENSICPIGADNSAKNRSDETAEISHKRSLLFREFRTMDFEKWLQKRGLKLEDLADDQASALRADYDAEITRAAAENAKPKKASDTAADETTKQRTLNEGAEAERKRQADIRKMGDIPGLPSEIVERCITDGNNVQEAQAVLYETMKGQQLRAAKLNIQVGVVRDVKVDAKLLEAGLLVRAGYGDFIVKDPDYGEQIVNDADKNFRDTTMRGLCEDAIALEGKVVPRSTMDLIRTAFSTLSLTNILGNVANKSMMRGYNYAPQTWRQWCNVGSASDFKTMTRARLTDTGELEEVGNSGEVPHGGATEEYEQYNIATYAKQFAITRTNIINDDLGALTRTPERMGRKANQKTSKLVYTHLLANGAMSDTVALFHADHSNLNTSSALAAATLAAAVAAFRNQVDSDKEPLDIPPAILLVPPSLENTAKGLATSELLLLAYGGSTASTVKAPAKNVFKDLALTVVVEPRLENSAYTGYSATTWYVTASPSQGDTIEVAFLNGRSSPIIERFVSDINTLGIGYRVLMDVGCKSLDSRTMQKNEA